MFIILVGHNSNLGQHSPRKVVNVVRRLLKEHEIPGATITHGLGLSDRWGDEPQSTITLLGIDKKKADRFAEDLRVTLSQDCVGLVQVQQSTVDWIGVVK